MQYLLLKSPFCGKTRGAFASHSRGTHAASGSTVVGGLMVEVLTGVFSPHWGFLPGTSRPQSRHQAVPGPPRASECLGALPGPTLLGYSCEECLLGLSVLSLGRSGHLWHLTPLEQLPYLGCGASGLTWQIAWAGLDTHISPVCITFVQLLEAFFHVPFSP